MEEKMPGGKVAIISGASYGPFRFIREAAK